MNVTRSHSCAHYFSATENVLNALQGLRKEFERLTACEYLLFMGKHRSLGLSTAWREDTERQRGELLETVRSVQGVGVFPPIFD